MHHILAKLTKKTLVAAASSLAMVGTAGAALGTSFSALEPTDTVVETTLVDTTAPDTTVVDTTLVDTTSPETTVLDTIVDTTLPDGADGLCEAWEKGSEHGHEKNVDLQSFGRVAEAADAAGVSIDEYCSDTLEAKDAAKAESADEDDADDDAAESEDRSGSSDDAADTADDHGGDSGHGSDD